jgi:hypothetical protein
MNTPIERKETPAARSLALASTRTFVEQVVCGLRVRCTSRRSETEVCAPPTFENKYVSTNRDLPHFLESARLGEAAHRREVRAED